MKNIMVELNADPRLSRVFISGELQHRVTAIEIRQQVGEGCPTVKLEVIPDKVVVRADEAKVTIYESAVATK